MSPIIEELSTYLKYSDTLNTEVSNWSVGAHIEHSTKVIASICKSVEQSDPKDYKPKFNLLRVIFLRLNWFPRGRAKAPKAVHPTLSSDVEVLKEYLEKADAKLKTLQGLAKNRFFKHPYFGLLNVKEARKFIKLHTHHHIKIIQEIIKKS